MDAIEEKVIINIYNLDYVSDVDRIDDTLKNIAGIKDSVTSYTTQQIQVTFDPEKMSEQKIIQILERLGYDVEIYIE